MPNPLFDQEYLKKSQMIFNTHQQLYGPLWELIGQITRNIDDTLDLSKVLNYYKDSSNINRNPELHPAEIS